MEDQHKKIKGYRDLTKKEIELINKIKIQGEELKSIITELRDLRLEQDNTLITSTLRIVDGLSEEQVNESYSNLSTAEDYLKTGMMWLTRSVALPDSF